MENLILASDMLGKCGVLCYQLESDIEAFHLYLFITTYGYNVYGSGRMY